MSKLNYFKSTFRQEKRISKIIQWAMQKSTKINFMRNQANQLFCDIKRIRSQLRS